MAQGKPNQNQSRSQPDESFYYSRLLRSKSKQMGLLIVFMAILFILTFIIGQNSAMKKNWVNVVIPILVFNVPILLYPLIDTWEYKPWQAKAQKYERHYTD